MASQDGLVALGGILKAATDAYTTSERERGEEVKRLREEFVPRAELGSLDQALAAGVSAPQ